MTESVEDNCIIECANILEESLEQIDFDLEDKFCDENDLRSAWNDMKMPNAFLLFLLFYTLLDCTKNDVLNDNTGTQKKNGLSLRLDIPTLMHFDTLNPNTKSDLRHHLSVFF